MFQGYLDRARHVVEAAHGEAHALSHGFVDPEHILLGLVNEGEGIAAMALASMEISPRAVRNQVMVAIGRGDRRPPEATPFSERTMVVLDLVREEAATLHHDLIGTHHILLALIRETEGVASRILVEAGADIDRTRRAVIAELTKYG